MVGIAVGQLGMSSQDALNTDINIIYLAEKAKWQENKICYGLKPEKEKLHGLSKEEAEAELRTINR